MEVQVFADGNPYHSAYLYAGLFALSAQERVKLKLVYPWHWGGAPLMPSDLSLWVEIRQTGDSRTVKICFDMHDKSTYLLEKRLEDCDIYFKRSFHENDLGALSAPMRSKVRPFGLSFACRTRRESGQIRRAISYWLANRLSRHVRKSLQQLYYSAYLTREYLRSPYLDEIEIPPSRRLARKIIFQTRVWAPEESCDGDDVSRLRVAVVRALKERFGPQFIGGLVATPFARRTYPDCILEEGTARQSYLAEAKKCLIGVYTRGLHHSTAWKLPEYLAMAKCIVAEPVRNALPVPLEEGTHFLPFRSAQDCVIACERLLNDDGLAVEMRRHNHEYYRGEVSPAARMMRSLAYAEQISPTAAKK